MLSACSIEAKNDLKKSYGPSPTEGTPCTAVHVQKSEAIPSTCTVWVGWCTQLLVKASLLDKF